MNQPIPDRLRLAKTLKKAVQLAQIADDWNLGTDGKVQIGSHWTYCSTLRDEFAEALKLAESATEVCTWDQTDDYEDSDFYENCHGAFEFNGDGEPGFKFCPYCGLRVEFKKQGQPASEKPEPEGGA